MWRLLWCVSGLLYEASMRSAFSLIMNLVDEEDAVLLYRCNRIAESSPLLLETMDMRRAAIEVALADRLNEVWQGARPRLLSALEREAAANSLDTR